MDLMQDLYLNDVLQAVAQALLVPVAVLLLAAILYALYSLGTLIVEALTERRRYRAIVPELVARVEIADYPGIASVVEESGLLRSQKDDLEELAAYLDLLHLIRQEKEGLRNMRGKVPEWQIQSTPGASRRASSAR